MSEQVGEIKRNVGVVVAVLRDDIRQVVECQAVIQREMMEFRNEVRKEFREARKDLTSVTL